MTGSDLRGFFVKLTTPLNDSNIIRAELSGVQFLSVSQK